MKVAEFFGPKDIRITEKKYPGCPENGIVLKVKAVGICGSDIRTYINGSNRIIPPAVIGHEIAGEVVEISKNESTFHVGDKLALAPGIYCNKCFYCLNGMNTMCENLKEIGIHYQGGFAEYLPIPSEAISRGRIVNIPKGLSFENAAICEPSSSCVMSQERANVSIGDNVVILGAGPIGCIHIQVARARGASKIIMIDVLEERLKMAEVFGADLYLNTTKIDPIDKIKKITHGLGADKVIVATPAKIAQELSINLARKRGTVIIFGGLPKDRPNANLDMNVIHYKDIQIMGHYGQEKRHVLQSLDLLNSDKIMAQKLITNILPLEDIIEGFELMSSKKALKVLLKPN